MLLEIQMLITVIATSWMALKQSTIRTLFAGLGSVLRSRTISSDAIDPESRPKRIPFWYENTANPRNVSTSSESSASLRQKYA